jgi:uncharacterized protein DUF6438
MRIASCSLLMLLFAAAGPCWQTVKSDELPPDTLIVLQRGACEHRCAVYNVIIFADGSVIFDGRHYVRQAGLIKSTISREALRKLLDEFTAAHFFNLKERYGFGTDEGCDSVKSDAPSAIVSLTSGGKAKVVLHHHRCVAAESDLLKRLEDKIDQTVNSAKWVK